jgi:hypothetical protein
MLIEAKLVMTTYLADYRRLRPRVGKWRCKTLSNRSKNQPNKTGCDDGFALRKLTPIMIAIAFNKSA